MNDKISELYSVLGQSKEFSNFFKDENELRSVLSTEEGINGFYEALNLSEEFKGMFSSPVEFSNTFELKKKDYTLPGETSVQQDQGLSPWQKESGLPDLPSTTPEKVEAPKEEVKERETTWMGDLLRSLKGSSLRTAGAILATPQMLNRTITGSIVRPLVKSMGGTDEEAEYTLNALTSVTPTGVGILGLAEQQAPLNKMAQKTEEKMAVIEGNIWENLTKGKDGEKDLGAALELFGRGTMASVPYLAMAAATAGGGSIATLGTISATAAAQQYAENEGMTESKKLLNAWMYGGFEAVGELASAYIFRGIGKAFRQGLVKELSSTSAKAIAKGIASSVGLEGSSEAITQIGQNVTDLVTGKDSDINIFSNVLDAAIIGGLGFGLVGGGAQPLASALGRSIASDKEVKQVQDNLKQQEVLINEIENTDSNPRIEILKSTIKDLRVQADEVMDANYQLAQKLSPEEKAKVAELYAVSDNLQAQIDNKEIPEAEIPEVENKIKGINDQIQTIKENLVKRLEEQAKAEKEAKIEELKDKQKGELDKLKEQETKKLDKIKDVKEGEKVNKTKLDAVKEEFDNKAEQVKEQYKEEITKVQEEPSNAESTGTKIDEGGEQPQGVEQGEEERLRVRDTTQDRVEAVTGKEVSKKVTIRTRPKTAEENAEVISDPLDVKRAELTIEKLILTSKSLDEFNEKLPYAFQLNEHIVLNKFVEDRISGKTNQSFQDWRSETQPSPSGITEAKKVENDVVSPQTGITETAKKAKPVKTKETIVAPKTLKQLEAENKSTAPKIPMKKVFMNDVEIPPREQSSKADDFIGNENTAKLPIETVDVADIVPTQKNLTISNLKKTQKVTDRPVLLKLNGKYYVLDGHHRIANEILNGAGKVEAHVYDAESITKKEQPVQKEEKPEQPKTKKEQLLERLKERNTPKQEGMASTTRTEEEAKSHQADVEKAVRPIHEGVKGMGQLHIVRSQEEMPAELLDYFKRLYGENVVLNGVYDWNTKDVWLFTDNLADANEAIRKWIHEVGVHRGLRTLVKDQLQLKKLLLRIFNSVGFNEIAKSVPLSYTIAYRNGLLSKERLAEEYLAFLGEKIINQETLNPKERTVWQQFVDFIRSNINRLVNRTVPFTEVEIANLVKASVASLYDNKVVDTNKGVKIKPDAMASVAGYNDWRSRVEKTLKGLGRSDKKIQQILDVADAIYSVVQAKPYLFPTGTTKKGTPIRMNVDPLYLRSLDMSADCPKRMAFAPTVKELKAKVRAEFNREITNSDIIHILLNAKKAGKTTPCIYCYVESPRINQEEMIGRWIDVMQGKDVPALFKNDKDGWKAKTAKFLRKYTQENDISRDDIDIDAIVSGQEPRTPFVFKKPFQYKSNSVPELHKLLFKLSTSQAKAVEPYEEYTGQIWSQPQERIDFWNESAGLRWFSSSDFLPEHMLDLIQVLSDMTARKMAGHVYTKVEDLIRVFAKTGMKIQMSLFMKAGTESNPQSDPTYSFDFEKAQEYRKANKDVGTEIMITNNKQLLWALATDWIDYIIPFHKSGSRIHKEAGFVDYEKEQKEKFTTRENVKKGRQKIGSSDNYLVESELEQQGWKIWDKSPTIEDIPKKWINKGWVTVTYKNDGKTVKGWEISVRAKHYGAVEGITDAQARENYLNICKEMGIVPVFANVRLEDGRSLIEHPNYIKVKKDYARTDTPLNPVDVTKVDQEAAAEIINKYMDSDEAVMRNVPQNDVIETTMQELKKNKGKPFSSKQIEDKMTDAGVRAMASVKEGLQKITEEKLAFNQINDIPLSYEFI